jgi:microcystin-dependent protein
MSDPFIGEIRMFGGNFAPVGWAFCDGSLLAISQNDALFTLIGTTYGGDGQSTFALPDLRGRLPIHMGTGPGLPNYAIGQAAGSETVTLNADQIPTHHHAFAATPNLGTDADPTNHTFARITVGDLYSSDTAQPLVAMSPAAVGMSNGGSQPHNNVMPFLCINFIISLFGIFPSQN